MDDVIDLEQTEVTPNLGFSSAEEPKRKIVVLTLTEYCNLDCTYCFERSKSKKFMSLQDAQEAVAFEFKNSDQFDEIEFDLFGGEPTLRKKMVMDLVEWTIKQKFSKPFLFFLETNGTLLDQRFKRWLLEHKEFVVAGVSIDGTRETHNKNRSDSYDDIDISFFVKNYPDQSVRMTVFGETVSTLSEDIIHLHGLGFNEVAATFAHGVRWNAEEIEEHLTRELAILCEFYLKNPTIKECSIFDINLPHILSKGENIEKWCGSGTSMVSYGIDGKKYPCHAFQPNTTGEVDAVELDDLDFSAVTNFRDPKCAECILEPVCPNCYGINYVTRGDIFSRDKGMCEIVKARALATSYLRARQIESKAKSIIPSELYQTIEAIKQVQSSL